MTQEKKVYEGRYISVTEEVSDSHTYERVYLRGGVAVMPVRNKEVLMILEDRAHELVPRWKLVSGWMDKAGYDALHVAQEELAEEIGMASEKWESVPSHNSDQGTIVVPMDYFIAHDPYTLPDPPENPDKDIVLDMKWLNLAQYHDFLDRGEIMWDRDALYTLKVLSRL